MTKNNKESKIIALGVIFFFILVTISSLTTNNASRLFIIPLRGILIGLVTSIICILLFINRIRGRSLIGVGLYTGFLCWGLMLSHLNGALNVGIENIIINFIVTSIGIALLLSAKSNELTKEISNRYVLYVLAGFLLTLSVNGIDFSFPPRFVFEHSSDASNQEILYSQGISKFFGYGAVASIIAAAASKRTSYSIWACALAMLFLLLSLLGGGRGDSIAAVAVVFVFLIFRAPLIIVVGLLMAMLGLLLFGDWLWIEDFIFFQRLSGLGDGDFGQRDALIIQAIALLMEEPRCLIVGCGIGFFQTYYGYEYSLYPHNFIVESIIIFGLPLITLFYVSVFNGIYFHYRKFGSVDIFFMLFCYSLLIQSKSGSFFGGWLFISLCAYFSMECLRRIKFKVHITRPNQ